MTNPINTAVTYLLGEKLLGDHSGSVLEDLVDVAKASLEMESSALKDESPSEKAHWDKYSKSHPKWEREHWSKQGFDLDGCDW